MVTALGSGGGLSGTYTVNNSQTVSSEQMVGGGPLPAPAANLFVSGVTGTIQAGMLVTDGGAHITGPPIQITGGTSPNFTVIPTYYTPFAADAAMSGTLTTLVPGQYILNSNLTTPVKIAGFGTGTGGLGTYTLSNSTNGSVASVGSPAAFTSTEITDGGPPAPGPALTIKDLGPGVVFPVTNYGSGTGSLALSGTFDTSVLGGTPTVLQAQVSTTAGGPPVSGCSACAWTNLSSYSTTLSSGTVFNWKGQAVNIPAAFGPLFVSVRAANGTAYATMPNYIKVGIVEDWQGEGQVGTITSSQAGSNIPTYNGLFGFNAFIVTGNGLFDTGPPVIGNWVPNFTQMFAGDRNAITGGGFPLSEGAGTFNQDLANAFGWTSAVTNSDRDGIGIPPETVGNAVQSQSIAIADGSKTVWCSASKFCANVGQGGTLDFIASSLTGAQVTGSVSGTTLTVSAIAQGALQPGAVLGGAGSSMKPGPRPI